MKKRKLSVVLTAVMLVSSCFFASCTPQQSLYHIAPKSYGEWDNNYIYCGNVRSKTTGEEDEYLIETLEKGGVEYVVKETCGYEYKADDIYMCLSVAPAAQENQALDSCLAVYNIKEKSSSVLYWAQPDEALKDVYALAENSILLETTGRFGSSVKQYIRLDYNGNLLSEDENWIEKAERIDDYFVFENNGDFFYCSIEDSNQIPMFSLKTAFNDYVVEYCENGEQKGLIIMVGEDEYSYDDRYSGLYFYDISKNKTTELVQYGTQMRVCRGYDHSDGSNYYVVGEWQEISYVTKDTSLEPIVEDFPAFFIIKSKQVTREYTGLKNCKLHQVNITSEGVSFDVLYDFAQQGYADADCSDFTITPDKNVYFGARQLVVRSGEGCSGGTGEEWKSYHLNVQTGKLTQKNYPYYSLSEKEIEQKKHEEGVAYGDYIYFIGESYIYDMDYEGAYVYTLYRYNTQSQREEAMQFWGYDGYEKGSRVENTEDGDVTFRYSVKMWEEVIVDFIVRNY